MVLVGTLTHVREVCPKEEKLQGGQDCRKHPEGDEIFCWQKKLEDVESHCHEQDLPDGDVLTDKAKIPNEKFP